MFSSQKVLGFCLASWAGAVVLLALSASTGAQTADSGKELFEKRCGGCHAMDRNKEGPRLSGVFGRTAASVEAFEYSSALKSSGITWTEETLNAWLTDTGKLVPDNDMTFRVERADERREIIAWLKRSSGK